MPEKHARAVRLAWAIIFAAALIVVLTSTAYSLRSTYDYSVAFQELGLDYDVQDDGSVKVGLLPGKGQKAPPLNLRITQINGHRVPPDATIGSLSEMLRAAPGPIAALRATSSRLSHSCAMTNAVCSGVSSTLPRSTGRAASRGLTSSIMATSNATFVE